MTQAPLHDPTSEPQTRTIPRRPGLARVALVVVLVLGLLGPVLLAVTAVLEGQPYVGVGVLACIAVLVGLCLTAPVSRGRLHPAGVFAVAAVPCLIVASVSFWLWLAFVGWSDGLDPEVFGWTLPGCAYAAAVACLPGAVTWAAGARARWAAFGLVAGGVVFAATVAFSWWQCYSPF